MANPTPKEKKAKRILLRLLRQQGYKTYADLFELFDLHITSDPDAPAPAWMEPGNGVIVLHSTLNMDQISTVIRHEILHEYLQHSTRLLKKLNAPSLNLQDYFKSGADSPSEVTIQDLIDIGYDSQMANYAADYEISNLAYTEEDKDIVRNIQFNGKVGKGLVTEDQHPDWVDLTMEEMYDKLMEQMKKDRDEFKQKMAEDEAKKHKNQEPETAHPDKEDQDEENGNNPLYNDDTYDEIWVYGRFDPETGQFFDDDDEVVNYEDTYAKL